MTAEPPGPEHREGCCHLPATMSVFTVQGVDLRCFSGRLDRGRGMYVDRPQISQAVGRLYDEFLHTDQVVWCSPEKPHVSPLPQAQFVHEIHAEATEIVAILDGFVWNHIIGNSRFIPQEDHAKLRHSLLRLPEDEYPGRLRQLEDDYRARNLPADLWANLISNTLDVRIPQLLLR